MKQLFLSTVCALLLVNLSAAEVARSSAGVGLSNQAVTGISTEQKPSTLDGFLSLSPKDYRKMTGKKMSLKKRLQLKLAKKVVKKQLRKANNSKSAGGEGITKGIYILLAVFGLAWLAMGLIDEWSGSNWVINLILTLLFWLPGFIHALLIMDEYFG